MKHGPIVRVLLSLSLAAFLPGLNGQSPSGPVAPQPGRPVQQPPPAKIVTRVELVDTPVTVRDNKGHMIHDLDAKDFTVTDNGVPQKITHFDLGGDPLCLLILVETSSRVQAMLPQLRKSGILLTETVMGPDGEAAIVGFSDSVNKLLDFTTDHDKVESTVNNLNPGTSGAKLFDAMALGVEMLSGRPQPTADNPGRRRVMLVISEAKDVGSDTKLGAVLRQAQLSNVTIYSVGLSTTRGELQAEPQDTTPQITPPGTFGGAPFPGSVQTPDTQAERYGSGNLLALAAWAVQHVKDKITDHALELATTATGGEHLPTFKNRSIEKAIDEIGGELHSQYSLTYTPTGTGETGYHEIKVAVDKSGLRVHARPGYYLAGPES
jgi:VWFA-related protein